MKKIFIILFAVYTPTILSSEKKFPKTSSSAPNSPRIDPQSPRVIPTSPTSTFRFQHSTGSSSLPPLPPKTPPLGMNSPSTFTSSLQRSPSATAPLTPRRRPHDLVRDVILENRVRAGTPTSTPKATSKPLIQFPSPAHSTESATSPQSQSDMRRLSTTSTSSVSSEEATQLKYTAMMHAHDAETARSEIAKHTQEFLEKCAENDLLKQQVKDLSAQLAYMTALLQQHGITMQKNHSRPSTPRSSASASATNTQQVADDEICFV